MNSTLRLRVLAVDDDDAAHAMFDLVLAADPRFEIVGRARNGAEAVELAAALDPDIVLMDLHMPVMNGAEATSRLREQERRPRIIIVTSSGDPAEILEALAAGADAHVPKPLTLQALLDALDAQPRD